MSEGRACGRELGRMAKSGHRGHGYSMKAAWQKWGQSTEIGAASTKWRGLECAGGPERVEGERDTWAHGGARMQCGGGRQHGPRVSEARG